MDGTRFDRLARAVASGSRRRFLAGLLAAVPAAAAASRPASARKGHGAGACHDASDCASGEACIDGTCVSRFVFTGATATGTVTNPYAVAAGSGRLFVTDVFGADDHVRVFAVSLMGQPVAVGSLSDSYSFALGLALDPAGRLYVASNAGVRVYAIGADDKATRVADIRGFSRASGVAVGDGFLFVASHADNTVRIFRIVEGNPPTYSLVATVDGFRSPEHLAAGGGQLYVADRGKDRVQVYGIDPGSGQATFQQSIAVPGPTGVAFGDRRLYVSSPDRNRVRVFAIAADGTATLEALLANGDGPIKGPQGLALAGAFLFIADSGNQRVDVFRVL